MFRESSVQQYRGHDIDAPLISPVRLNRTEAQMAKLGSIALLDRCGIGQCSFEWEDNVERQCVEAVKRTSGDTSPEALKKALAGLSLETPMGPLSFVECVDA
jgi:hypothetical protein